MADPRVLFYFADPMCSWCWGFAPTVERIQQQFGDELLLVLVLAGLRPAEAVPLDASTRKDVLAHWDHVAAASGQPFARDAIRREGFVYDTEPACRAVVTARTLGRAEQDEGVGLRMLRATQQAYYAEGRDVTDGGVLADVAASIGLDRAEFVDAFSSVDAREATYRDFVQTRSFGVHAFPTLIAASADEALPIATGFASYDEVEAQLRAFLAGVPSAVAAGAPA